MRSIKIFAADPKLGFMVFWTGQRVAEYCKEKGWRWMGRMLEPEVAARIANRHGAPAESMDTRIQYRAPWKRKRR